MSSRKKTFLSILWMNPSSCSYSQAVYNTSKIR